VTAERKFAILFAATILAARKLLEIDPNKPNMAKQFYVDHAIMMLRSSSNGLMRDGLRL
jgi:hypothetical protein